MEEVHGVDVSWMHKPKKGAEQQHHHLHHHSKSSSDARKDVKPPITSPPAQQPPPPPRRPSPQPPQASDLLTKLPSPPNVTPPTPVEPTKDVTNAYSSTPTPSSTKPQALHVKRPSLLARSSSAERTTNGERPQPSKRQSWMNSLSSKFSSQGTPERPGSTPIQQPQTPPATNGSNTTLETAVEEAEPYTPAKPKESSSSFFSSLTRRLSSQSQMGGIPKVQGSGGVCARRVLNVDPNRERCTLPEMDPSRLRKVSFCVDVEIAGGNRYREDDEDEEERKRKQKQFKMKEKAEGAALKNPEALIEEKDEQGEPKLEAKSKDVANTANNGPEKAQDESVAPQTEEERDAAARKREKKQKSEAERKERKEKRRRRAEENGQIPVELPLDGDDEDATAGAPATSPPQQQKNGVPAPKTPQQPQPSAARQDRPTTDPARIYRRCCQLRESPILKRITEQLSNPRSILPQEPGVVNCLDLTGSRLQLADVVSLGDWLAVVPVKHLKLEDADLNDEGVRCILAGLLAAKRPEPSKRRSITPRHRESFTTNPPHTERSGVVEKITFKNNPRMTKVGWKHISLFIYMCRSLRAIDVSMNFFPQTLPPSNPSTPVKNPQNAPNGKGQEIDAAEALFQCLSQRLGGRKLEELIMSECGLDAQQIRKIVDGVIACGVSRLGFAGNRLNDEALEHVLGYLRSGTCQALDLGGNDLRDKLDVIANSLSTKSDLPCWGLSLADCNLDSTSLKPLFAQLVKLPSFRFIDLSHNRDLCSVDNGLITLLRRYVGQLKDLKRIHLADVGMSPKQAIALADVMSEGPRLAHVNLLDNPQLMALASAKTETDQEEACALYASLMAAARVSNTIICIDIDVPASDNSEVVKALAKQVVAYSLRNMEQTAIAEATGEEFTAKATAALTGPHGGEKGMKDFTVPDVLMHLVGHAEGVPVNHDNDDPAPDEDYIVGGTGVVKALQYVLGEKADDKRVSIPSTPSGTLTPKDRPASSAGLVEQGKAKKMSKNLLGSARKIRDRLQPALIKEAAGNDEISYRRLLFLDQTLQSMIQRFEEEYPETRLAPPSPEQAASVASSFTDQPSLLAPSDLNQGTDMTGNGTDEEEFLDVDEGGVQSPPVSARKGSDVSLAARAQAVEEGRLHRMGQHLRREVIDSPRTAEFKDIPWESNEDGEHDERLRQFGQRVENISGIDLRKMVDEEGWENLLQRIGGNYEDLRQLQEQDPEGWEGFKTAQANARINNENLTQGGKRDGRILS